jgi:hypothetical protein
VNRLERVVFVVLCVVAVALLVLTVLVLAGVGVKDKSSGTVALVLSHSSRV